MQFGFSHTPRRAIASRRRNVKPPAASLTFILTAVNNTKFWNAKDRLARRSTETTVRLSYHMTLIPAPGPRCVWGKHFLFTHQMENYPSQMSLYAVFDNAVMFSFCRSTNQDAVWKASKRFSRLFRWNRKQGRKNNKPNNVLNTIKVVNDVTVLPANQKPPTSIARGRAREKKFKTRMDERRVDIAYCAQNEKAQEQKEDLIEQ